MLPALADLVPTGIRNGLTRMKRSSSASSTVDRPCCQTTAGISLAMLVLYPCDLVMISRFGWLMAALIAAAYIGDVILLQSCCEEPWASGSRSRSCRTRCRSCR